MSILDLTTPPGVAVDLAPTITAALDRWPSAGLAVGIVRGGALAWFDGHGVADVTTRTPVTPQTVFRIGSVTKTFTAIAVMQLVEDGLVDLDEPAAAYLRAFRLVPAGPGLRPPTVRHLLTHTAGIGYWRRLSDLRHPGIGSGDLAGAVVPSLPDYYRRGLPVEVPPGTKWVYSNHGFAVLGQIVADVSGVPIDRYLRERVLTPLGMDHSDLGTSDRVRGELASGCVLRSRGLRPASGRDVLLAAAGGMHASTADLGRYVAALMAGGAGERGRVLDQATIASMFAPHFRPDPRVHGMGLAFHLGAEDGHRTVGHAGVVSGFLSAMVLAPDDDLGVVVLANTGGLDGRGAPEGLAGALLRRLLGLPDSPIRTDIPPDPSVWADLCGAYELEPGPVTNLFLRAIFGAGVRVVVRDGRLLMKGLTPVPTLRRGLRLYPDDPDDPDVFRVDFAPLGKGSLRVVFRREPPPVGPVVELVLDSMVLRRKRRPADAR